MAQANFLERLLAEWYQYRGWYVQMNVLVGKRAQGGHEGELDVVAYRPATNEVHHIECSMDTDSWAQRKERIARKFNSGRKYVEQQFPRAKLTQKAVLAYVQKAPTDDRLGGAEVVTMRTLFSEIHDDLKEKPLERAAVSENYPLMRTIQFYIGFGPKG